MSKGNSLKQQVKDCDKSASDLNEYITNKLNVAEPNKPHTVPDFPADVTSITSEDTGRFLAAYDAEIAYIRFILAQVEVKLLQAKAIIKTYRDQLFLAHRKTQSYNDAVSWTSVDHSLVDAETEARQMEGEKLLLEARLDIFTKYSASISREITRRKQDSFTSSESGGGAKPSFGDKSGDRQSARIKQIAGKELNPGKKNSKK